MDAQKLEQIQKVFANDRFATDNGAVIEQVDEGYAKCWLEIQPHHLNAAGTVMEGPSLPWLTLPLRLLPTGTSPSMSQPHPRSPTWVLPEAHAS